MLAIKCVVLFITLFHGRSNFVVCKTLHLCDSSQYFHNSSCLTLSEFAIDERNYTGPNTTLIFGRGNHTLATGIVVSNIVAFSMLSITKAAIHCHEGANMTFLNVSEVYIHGLVFLGCGGNSVHLVKYLKIEESNFHGIKVNAASMLISESNANITGTAFLLNSGSYIYPSDIEIFVLIKDFKRFATSENVDVTITAGGAFIIASSNVTIDHCVFRNNSANFGGAIFVKSNSNIFLNNSVFTLNQAIACQYSNFCSHGGALYFEGQSVITIYNCTFRNNTSLQNGGLAYLFNATLLVLQSNISNSTASRIGGAIYADTCIKVKFNSTMFKSNNAGEHGGAMYLRNSGDTLVIDCSFVQNRADGDGGTISLPSIAVF